MLSLPVATGALYDGVFLNKTQGKSQGYSLHLFVNKLKKCGED